ncbi:hypothetical protein L7F22_048808 [Adiantum nelumboides]|nr:hypothetical protein [Adiantum nelumboides]
MVADKHRFLHIPLPWPLCQQVIPFARFKVSKHLVVAKLLAFLVLVLFLLPMQSLCVVHVDYIDAGFSASAMSHVDSDGIFLYSTSLSFAVALHAFTGTPDVYLNVIHTSSHEIVWTANRDSPISPSDMFNFSPSGNVVLMSGNGSRVLWSTKTRGATRMQIKETGNLVLLDSFNNTLWESFDNPTNTLLSGQVLGPKGAKLVSSTSETNLTSGSYSLSLESGDLHLLYHSQSHMALPYWSMSTDTRLVTLTSGAPSLAIFNNSGLSLATNKSVLISLLPWSSNATLSRATLETDGNLRVYVFSSNVWAPLFVALVSNCNLPLFCGKLGLCNGERCTCPGTLHPVNKNVITEGCQGPSKVPTCSNNSSFEKIADNLDYFANQYIQPVRASGLDACKALCLNECNCSSLFFHNKTGFCYLFDELATVQSTSELGHTLFMKTTGAVAVSQGPNKGVAPSSQAKELPLYPILGVVGSSMVVIFVMIGIFTCWCLTRQADVNGTGGEHGLDDDDFFSSVPGPKRFSFQELQTATNDFSNKLGTGGFGSVYEGLLPDQTKVAVKKLESVGQGRKEFRAEVAIIGSIHHIHLVQLHGFCVNGVHKLLVYEFMSKGSLHTCMFENGVSNQVLDWNTRHKIALGTARGLAYLHNECRETILHCDIKPENILLDENFNAKVSDFGLAKLLSKEQSQVFTTMRGTRGYLAPEWLLNLPISDRTDVYSFGMVLLEIFSGRKNYEPTETPEKCYLPAFAFAQAARGHLAELLDGRLKGSVSDDKVIETIGVALLCIQEEISSRPSMATVVQMLEGNIVCDLSSCSLKSLRLHASMAEVLMASQKTSSVASAGSCQSRALLSSVKSSA